MYVRRKTVMRKTVTGKAKPYTYYQLVEGRRVDGRVRQKVVKHLGDWPDRERAEIHARRLGLLCCAEGCTRRAGAGIVDL